MRRTSFDTIPIKPQRVFEEMNRAFGSDVRYVSTIGLSQIQAAQLLHVYRPRHWINAGQPVRRAVRMPAAAPHWGAALPIERSEGGRRHAACAAGP